MSSFLLLSSLASQKVSGIVIIPPDDDDIIIEQETLSLILPVPGGVTNKDALVALISTDGDPTLTPPAGWTLEANIGGTAKSFLYYRISSGDEPATYTWTLDGTEDAVGAILRLRNVNTDNLINAKVTDSGTGSIVTIPAITTTVDKTMLITLLSLNDGALIDESELKKSQRKGLWVVNTSGEVIGSVGSSANYKTIKKAGIEPAYNLQTIGDVSTDYYSVQVAFNPRGSNPPVISTPALLDSKTGGDTNYTSFSTNPISPSANALVIISCSKLTFFDDAFTIATTLNTVSGFTKIREQYYSNLNAYEGAMFWAIMTGSPGTGTITITHGHNGNKWNLITVEIASGFDAITPILQSASVGVQSFNIDVTLSDLASSSLVLGCGQVRGNGAALSPGTGYTEIAEQYAGIGNNADSALQVQYDIGNLISPCSWNVNFDDTNFGIAAEIARL